MRPGPALPIHLLIATLIAVIGLLLYVVVTSDRSQAAPTPPAVTTAAPCPPRPAVTTPSGGYTPQPASAYDPKEC